MKKEPDIQQAEELSRCLDSLNAGIQPATQDEEVQELIEVAAYVKKSYQQQELPQTEIQQMVDRLAAELGGKKSKRHGGWWYGGLAGAAAAVLFAVSTHLLWPKVQTPNIAQQVPYNERMETQNGLPAGNPTDSFTAKSAEVVQQVQAESTVEHRTIVPEKNHFVASVSKAAAEIVNIPEVVDSEQKPVQVAMVKENTAAKAKVQKDAVIAKAEGTNTLRNGRSLERSAVMMAQSDSALSSEAANQNNDIIRRIYNQGTDDEIIVTKRPIDKNNTQDSELINNATELSAVGEAKNGINSLTVKFDRYYITVEGKKTTEELRQIAQSLDEEDIKSSEPQKGEQKK